MSKNQTVEVAREAWMLSTLILAGAIACVACTSQDDGDHNVGSGGAADHDGDPGGGRPVNGEPSAGGGDVNGNGSGGAPACASNNVDQGAVCLRSLDAGPEVGSFTAVASVVGVSDVVEDGTECVSLPAKEFLLRAADGRQWRAQVTTTELTSDVLQTGDSVDLSFEVVPENTFYRTHDSTFVVSRDGQLVLFGTDKQKFGFAALPDLSAYGITIADNEFRCTVSGLPSLGCPLAVHGELRVTRGAEAKTIVPGQRSRIGDLVVALSAYHHYTSLGSCDTKGSLRMSGFIIP